MSDATLQFLIAEDDPAHAVAIKRALENFYPDARLDFVSTKVDYRDRILSALPSIALLDLNLSDGSTIELLTSPISEAAFPIIIMTSNGSEQLAADAIKRGALDYLVKSVNTFATLGTTVAGALREWQLIQDKKRIEKELKESQSQIIHQEKMASIGQLAAGVAHEINNPMGYITSNLASLARYADKLSQFLELQEKILQECGDQSAKAAIIEQKQRLKIDFIIKDLLELVTDSLEGAGRVTRIVQDLKSFSRSDSDKAILSDLNDCIKSTINIVHNEIKYVAELNLQLGDIPQIICYPQQISQVVMNLLVNAAHAIVERGVITVSTVQKGNAIEITVADTGSGIAPENMKKIFEPFFTTKDPGKGTGLGLAISADIIRKHGGELLVATELGKGTTFTVRLPVCNTVQ